MEVCGREGRWEGGEEVGWREVGGWEIRGGGGWERRDGRRWVGARGGGEKMGGRLGRRYVGGRGSGGGVWEGGIELMM